MSLNVGNPDKKLSPNITRAFATDAPLISPDPKFADPPKAQGEGKKPEVVRKQFAPHGDKPTTAAGEPGTKDLPSLLKKVDPNNLSSVLPQMFALLGKINSTMNSSSQSSRKNIIQDSLTGALAILNRKYGFQQVLETFNKALENNGISKVNADYQDTVKNALANFIKKAAEVGPQNIPVPSDPKIEYTIILPVPIVIDSAVPDLSIQQYYTAETDPYPGYIQWFLPEGTLSTAGTNFVYTRRTPEQPPYESADDEIFSISEKELAKGLDPYVRDVNLTVNILNDLLLQQDSNVQKNGMEKNLGKNSSTNLMQLLPSLLGIAGQILNQTKSGQLPQSVLNQGSINKSLEKFSENMSMLKKMKQDAEQAFKLPSPLQGLPGLNNLVSGLTGNILGGLAPGLNLNIPNVGSINVSALASQAGLNVSQINSVVSQVNQAQTLLNNIGIT
jgi:hypothetical protein